MIKLDIEPFNEVWYGNCFMHSILPILKYNGINLSDFLKEETILYYFFNNNINIGLEKVQNLDYYLNLIGFKLRYIDELEPVKTILSYIDKSIPIIVWVDCFYLSERLDTFNKTHLAHCLLIYGYDLKKSEFIILEHDYANGLQFKEKRISFNECKYCMMKYKEFYKRNFCFAVLVKEKKVITKEFEYEENNKKLFWQSIEKDLNEFKVEKFERLMDTFGIYERLLKALMYANKKDYSYQIRNTSLIKILFGKATYYSKMSIENQNNIAKLFKNIHIT